ncbi:MAG TPA: AAA family ATPase [Candidatus Binataceae bacterium]|nr:AAA family ATPase [Candidatus Binataceae bacterium]
MQPAAGPRKTRDGERRHLTVLFCDLVNSTEIASGLDPEEWQEVTKEYQRVAAEAVTRFGGFVAKYLGDGLLAYFGYPQAHEDDAERGVRAGLAIIEAMAPLNLQLSLDHRPQLAARVGIHTGSVVIGQDAEVFGDTPNIAAHLQAVADPNSVLITATVHRLVSGRFVVEKCGPRAIKGVAKPMEIFRVERLSGVRGRLHISAAASHGLTPFIGREEELRLIASRWNRAREGEGQTILITGESGIGKSRLIHQFRESIADTPHTWVECSCEQFVQSTPFYAVTDMLQQGFGWRSELSAQDRIAQLERTLNASGLGAEKALPLVAPLLNLPTPEKYAPSLTPPEQQRRKLLATLAAWTFATAAPQPMIMVFEDLQWSDPSTLDLLQILADQGATASLLLLFTARPEFRPPWAARGHHLQLALDRLSRSHVREMVLSVTRRKTLGRGIVERVVERTGGVPLYVEELTQFVLEGVDSASGEIPATLHDSLMSRLDRLGPAKEVAQVGATLGRDFSYELLHAVLPLPEPQLRAALDQLTDAELLYARGIAPEATYLFKHELVREAAYQALLKSRRRELHRTIAEVLSERTVRKSAADLERLAHHYTEAGEIEPALSTWQRAGAMAVASGALVEAEHHYTKAVGLLAQADESPARAQRDMMLQVQLGQVLIATRGYGAPEVSQAYNRARELGEQIGDPAQLPMVLLGLWLSALTSGELRPARALAEQMLAAVERAARPELLVWGNYAQGITLYHLGDLTGAQKYLSQALDYYNEEDHRHSPQDPGPGALSYLSRAALQLGGADTARARIASALAMVQRSNRPFDLCFVRSIAAGVFLWLREPGQALEHADALIAAANTQQLPFFAADGAVLRGRAIAALGQPDEGVGLIREGIASSVANRQRTGLAYYFGFLAEAQAMAGVFDDALTSVEEALAAVPEEQVFRSHLVRLRGEIRLQKTAGDQSILESAEQDFRESLKLAQSMSAKLDELRAVVSLARMRRSGAEAGGFREQLARLIASFNEGLDTVDLVEARELLSQLEAPSN